MKKVKEEPIAEAVVVESKRLSGLVHGSVAGPNHPARFKKKRFALPDLPDLLAEVLSEKKGGKTAARLILAALRQRAVAGDVRAAEVLLDRAYGKAPQEINVNKTERQIILLGGQKLEF